MALTKKQNIAFNKLASKLEVNPKWLYRLIKFESGFNPSAKNPLSSARGLIQFVDSTARRLGYKSSKDLVKKNPTIEKQLLGPVYKYLKKYKPFPTDQALFMSVFYPIARYWDPERFFPYDPVRMKNPGINQVKDYVNKVWRRRVLPKKSPLVIMLLIGGGIMLYILSKNGG